MGGEYRKGDKVEARYRGKSQWFKGVIGKENSDGTYVVNYDDGDTEKCVRA